MAVGIADVLDRWAAIKPAMQVYMGLSVDNCAIVVLLDNVEI